MRRAGCKAHFMERRIQGANGIWNDPVVTNSLAPAGRSVPLRHMADASGWTHLQSVTECKNMLQQFLKRKLTQTRISGAGRAH